MKIFFKLVALTLHDFFCRFKSLNIVSLIISGSSGMLSSSFFMRSSFSYSRYSFFFSKRRLCYALAWFRIFCLSSLFPLIDRDSFLSCSIFYMLNFSYCLKSRVVLVLFLDSLAFVMFINPFIKLAFVFCLRLVLFIGFKLAKFVTCPSKV
jgi:hypothetical protein